MNGKLLYIFTLQNVFVYVLSSLLLQKRIAVSPGISRRGFGREQRKGESKQNLKPAPSKLVHLDLLSVF